MFLPTDQNPREESSGQQTRPSSPTPHFHSARKTHTQTARIKTVVYRLLFSHVFPHEYPVGIKCKTKSIRNYPFKNENLLDE